MDPHHVLGVPRGSGLLELRAAFRREVLLRHPDKGGTAASFRAVLLAFRTLAGFHRKRTLGVQSAGRAPRRPARRTAAACPGTVQRPASKSQMPGSHVILELGIGAPQKRCSPGGRTNKAVFLRALRTLQKTLALTPAEARRSAIQQLSPALRQRLASFVERSPLPSWGDCALAQSEAGEPRARFGCSLCSAGPDKGHCQAVANARA